MAQTVIVTIDNRTGEKLTRKPGTVLDWGDWSPGGREPPLDALAFGVETHRFMTGCEGTVVYTGPSGSLSLYFDNPYWGDNKFAVTADGSYVVDYQGTQGTHAQLTCTALKDAPGGGESTPPPSASQSGATDSNGGHVPLGNGSAAVLSHKTGYNRDLAVKYAIDHATIPCSDGFIALGSGLYEVPLDKMNGDPDSMGPEHRDDCTHFVSCCIGAPYDAAAIKKPSTDRRGLDPKTTKDIIIAGGLPLPVPSSDAWWVYGMTGAPRLYNYLLARNWARVVYNGPLDIKDPTGRNHFTSNAEAVPQQVEPGDLIAVFHPDSLHAPFHFMIYLGRDVTDNKGNLTRGLRLHVIVIAGLAPGLVIPLQTRMTSINSFTSIPR